MVRYPRGRGVLVDWRNEPQDLPIGKGRVLREGERVLVLSLGPLGNNVTQALDSLQAENIRPGHVDVRFLKPLDEELLRSLAAQYPVWLTVEDGTEKGGLFSAVAEFLEDNNLNNQLHHIAIPDRFISHGDIPNIYHEVGFDVESVKEKIRRIES